MLNCAAAHCANMLRERLARFLANAPSKGRQCGPPCEPPARATQGHADLMWACTCILKCQRAYVHTYTRARIH